MPIIAGADKAKPKSVAAMIVESMGGGEKKPSPEHGDGPFLAKQFIAAVSANDDVKAYHAFKALFQHCEMEPHEEYGEENEAE